MKDYLCCPVCESEELYNQTEDAKVLECVYCSCVFVNYMKVKEARDVAKLEKKINGEKEEYINGKDVDH